MDYPNDNYNQEHKSFVESGFVGAVLFLVGWVALMAVGCLAAMGRLQ